MLGIVRPEWCEEDRLLAQAHDYNESQRCPGCGHFLDETTQTDGHHSAHTIRCDACAAIEQHQRDEKTPEPGTRVYADVEE